MGLQFSKSVLTKGLILFILLSISVMVGILIWTTDAETWANLASFRLEVIPILVILAFVRWYIDGMAFVTMAKHGSKSSVGVNRAAMIRLQGNLVASIVPVLVGTVTMHAYMLHKEKLKLSESVAITTLRAILPIFVFLLNIPILFFFRSDPVGGKFFARLIEVLSLPIVVVVVFIIITLFYPQKIKRLASKLVHWWGRIRFLHMERISKLEERFFHEIDQFSKVFWIYLKKRKAMLFKASGWILGAFLADYLLAIVIIWGFGIHPPIIRALAIQFLMRPIIYLAFTPGGAGIWEFTYAGFFFEFLPKSLVGVSVLIWRLLLTYLPSIVGSVMLVREFNKDRKLKSVLFEKNTMIEEELDNMGDSDPYENNEPEIPEEQTE